MPNGYFKEVITAVPGPFGVVQLQKDELRICALPRSSPLRPNDPYCMPFELRAMRQSQPPFDPSAVDDPYLNGK